MVNYSVSVNSESGNPPAGGSVSFFSSRKLKCAGKGAVIRGWGTESHRFVFIVVNPVKMMSRFAVTINQ